MRCMQPKQYVNNSNKARLCLMTCSAGTQQGTCNRAEVLNKVQDRHLYTSSKVINSKLDSIFLLKGGTTGCSILVLTISHS